MTIWESQLIDDLQRFLKESISALEFEQKFLQDKHMMSFSSDKEYKVYMELFYAVDAFYPDDSVVEHHAIPSINETELRQAALDFLQKIQACRS